MVNQGPSTKRFNVLVHRDKLYDLTNGNKGSQLPCNRNGEAEVITVILRQVGTIKKLNLILTL
jgi:topoisomerase-4 subunit A